MKKTFVNHEGKMMEIDMRVSHPTVPEAKKLTKDDVWGKWTEPGDPEYSGMKLISRGMVVAQGYAGKMGAEYAEWKKAVQVSGVCPVWGDRLPYKSVTVVCMADQQQEVEYWLEYVHGGGSVQRVKGIGDGKIAIRSNYQCW